MYVLGVSMVMVVVVVCVCACVHVHAHEHMSLKNLPKTLFSSFLCFSNLVVYELLCVWKCGGSLTL